MDIYVVHSGNNYGEEFRIRFVSCNYKKTLLAAKEVVDIEEKNKREVNKLRPDDSKDGRFEEEADFSDIIKNGEKILKYWSNRRYWVAIELFKDGIVYSHEWYNDNND